MVHSVCLCLPDAFHMTEDQERERDVTEQQLKTRYSDSLILRERIKSAVTE